MKILFDTSVVIAAFEVSHPRHAVCLPWLQRAQEQQITGCLSAHSLAESYSVLTRLPVKPLIAPGVAQYLITENLKRFDVVLLTQTDYEQAIAQMVRLNLPGEGIYDALIAQAFVKANCDRLFTLNPNHFTRLGDAIAQCTQVPI